jgi:beta-N-acetylhexosaminidase
MTAHILLQKLDPEWPASLSHRVLRDLLRREMHFDGIVFADDLGMGAIAKRHGLAESIVRALDAGTDIVMLCHDSSAVPAAVAALMDAVTSKVFDSAEWNAGRKRISRLRQRIASLEMQSASQPRPPLELLGCAEHRALAAEVHARLSGRLS